MIKTLTLHALATLAVGTITSQVAVAQSTLANPLTDAQAVAMATALTEGQPKSEVVFVKTKFHTYGADLNTTSTTLTDSTFILGTNHRFVAQSEPIAKTIAQGSMTDFTTEWTLEGHFERYATGEVRFNVKGLHNAIFLDIEKATGLYLHGGYIIPEGLEVSGITGSNNPTSRGLYFTWNTAGLIVGKGTPAIVRTTTAGRYAITLYNEVATAKALGGVLKGSGLVGENAGTRNRHTYAFTSTADSLGLVRVSATPQAPITLHSPYAVYATINEGNVKQFLTRPENSTSTAEYIRFEQDLTTGIARITTLTPNANTSVYDLHGRQVGTTATFDALPRGIYVVGGTKVVR